MEKAFKHNMIDSMNSEQLATRGKELMADRRFDDAAVVYQKLCEMNPNDGNILNSLGSALFMAGWQDQAINCLRQAIGAKPDNLTFHMNLAKMLMVAGCWEEAASRIELALGKRCSVVKEEWQDLLSYCRKMIAAT